MEQGTDPNATVEDDIRRIDTTLPPVAPVDPEEQDLDNGWTEYREKLVKTYRLNALRYRYLHRESVKYYAFWRSFLEIALISLTSLGTAQSIWSNTVTDQINKVIIFLSTFLSVLSKFLSYPQLQIQHTVAGKKFLELFNSAEIQLLAPRRQRAPAQAFVQELLNSFTALEGASPEVPKRIRDDLKKNPEKLAETYRYQGDLESGDEEQGQRLGVSATDPASAFVRDNNVELAQTGPQMNESVARRIARAQLERFSPLTDSTD